jgi:hypothetical protein
MRSHAGAVGTRGGVRERWEREGELARSTPFHRGRPVEVLVNLTGRGVSTSTGFFLTCEVSKFK